MKTTVCTGSDSTTESSAVFPATAAVGTSPPTVPGSEDEVGGHSMKCHIVCVSEKEKKGNSMCELGYQNIHTQQKTVLCVKTISFIKIIKLEVKHLFAFYSEDKFGMITKK